MVILRRAFVASRTQCQELFWALKKTATRDAQKKLFVAMFVAIEVS